MFRTISLPLFYLLLCSCSREVTMPVDSAASERPVTAELRITTEDMLRLATRATDEEAIRDINLYLFGRSNGQSLHFYSRSALVRFECLPGEYDLYVAANLGADLGERSAQQLLDYTIKWQEEYATLPMSAVMTVAIAPDKENNTVTLPPLSVRRTVAKIAYNIRVADKVPDLELRSVRLCSVPGHTTPFTPASTPSTSEKDFTDAPLVELPDAARRSCSGVQYLFENPQGTVPSITDQRDKTADNAPACASYLMIRATRGSRILDYRIYLGENNTTDFNVGRNTAHTLDITISGDNEVDTRVHGYTLSVTDDFESNRIGDYCVLPFNASLYVNIERTKSEPTLTGELELLTPTDGTLLVDYEECASRLDLPINRQQGSNYYELVYYPKVITEARARLTYEVRVRDSYGYESRSRFEHRFANALYVAPPTGGTVTAARALHVEKPTGGTLRAACYEQGCTLTAKAAAGYRFAGWYADEGHSELLCGTETYSFVPETYRTWIYPYFEASKIHIITDIYKVSLECDAPYEVDQDEESFIVPAGSRCTLRVNYELPLFRGWYDQTGGQNVLLGTARSITFTATEKRAVMPGYLSATNLSAAGTVNSYIAAAHNAGYRFNSRVQGNGRATTGLTPATLSGTTARVLWESGGTRGGVVAEVEHTGSTICFRTGPNYGNALIGLFDAAGRCIWSWHIWHTNYDPWATAQTCASGYTFMDRNLGALTTSVSDPSLRGLYYQWGRPAPFLHPSSVTSTVPAAFISAAGYEYYVHDPLLDGGSVSMTPARALAEPWAYWSGLYAGDSNDIDDWVTPQNLNLWGNASRSGSYSTSSSKSIYDPCPPGWRVPAPAAFEQASFSRTGTSRNNVYYLRSRTGTSVTYPMGGYFTGHAFRDNGTRVDVWTNAPAQLNGRCLSTSTAFTVSASTINTAAYQQRDYALPVRCVAE